MEKNKAFPDEGDFCPSAELNYFFPRKKVQVSRPGEAEVMTRAVASMVITWSVADPPALTKLTCEGRGTAGRDNEIS